MSFEWGGDDPRSAIRWCWSTGSSDHAHTWDDTVAAGLAGRFHIIAPGSARARRQRIASGLAATTASWITWPIFMRVIAPARAAAGVAGRPLDGRQCRRLLRRQLSRAHPPPGPARRARTAGGRAGVAGSGAHRLRCLDAASRSCRRAATAACRKPPRAPGQDRLPGFPCESWRCALAERELPPAPMGPIGSSTTRCTLRPAPYLFSVNTASQFWQKVRCPVLVVDAADSDFTSPPPTPLAVSPPSVPVRVPHADRAPARCRPYDAAPPARRSFKLLADFLAD